MVTRSRAIATSVALIVVFLLIGSNLVAPLQSSAGPAGSSPSLRAAFQNDATPDDPVAGELLDEEENQGEGNPENQPPPDDPGTGAGDEGGDPGNGEEAGAGGEGNGTGDGDESNPEDPVEGEATPNPDDTGQSEPDADATPTGDDVQVADTTDKDPGTLIINKTDENDQVLPGACFRLTQGFNFVANQCDFLPGEGNDGLFTFSNLEPGEYTITEDRAPSGYLVGHIQDVTINAGAETEITVKNQLGGYTLQVFKVDGAGAALGGACFTINQNVGGNFGPFVTSNCDAADPAAGDGATVIPGIPPGEYWLDEFLTPSGYAGIEPIAFTMGNADRSIEVVNDQRAAGNLIIEKVDENGAPLAGACFSVSGSTPFSGGLGCDEDDGPDGTTTIGGLAPGSYTVFETQAPPGYVAVGGGRPVVMTLGQSTRIEVGNVPGGELILFKTDENEEPLPGSCFGIQIPGTDELVAFSCDTFDGSNDGVLHFDLPAGTYFAGESFAPPGYGFTASGNFEITAGQTTQITVQNIPGGQSIQIAKVDESSQALENSCFQVVINLNGQRGQAVAGGCDSFDGANDGQLVLAGLAPGSYLLVETFAPLGFVAAADIPFVLAEGGSPSFEVVNRPGEGEFGALEIRKTDEKGTLLPGACYALFSPDGLERITTADNCDGGPNDPDATANGIFLFPEVRGTFLVRETRPPVGYHGGSEQTVTIDAGEFATITFINTLKSGESKPDDRPDKPDKPGGSQMAGGVELGGELTLPNTGAGLESSGGTFVALLGLASLVLLAGAYLRTRPAVLRR